LFAYKESFVVEDVSGARFRMHRFTRWRFLSRLTRYQLDTGEPARRIHDHTFALVATGERLMRA
jgi:hypothetical protein